MFKKFFNKVISIAMKKVLPFANKVCSILMDEARNTIIVSGIGMLITNFLFRMCKRLIPVVA